MVLEMILEIILEIVSGMALEGPEESWKALLMVGFATSILDGPQDLGCIERVSLALWVLLKNLPFK